MCFCTTNFWAKYLIFSPQIEANNVLTPLQCFSPSGPNHTLMCTAWRGQKKHPNLFASRQITKNLPQQGRKCSPSSLIHALIIQSYKSSMSSCSEGGIEENYKFVKTSKKKKNAGPLCWGRWMRCTCSKALGAGCWGRGDAGLTPHFVPSSLRLPHPLSATRGWFPSSAPSLTGGGGSPHIWGSAHIWAGGWGSRTQQPVWTCEILCSS